MAAARLGYLVGPAWLVAELEKVVLPYHLDAAKQVAGRLALRFVDEMEARVAGAGRRARAARGRAGRRCRSTSWPSGANFVLFRPHRRDGRDVWQALLDRGVLVRDCSAWPRLAGCLRVTVGTPAEDDALPRRARPRCSAMSRIGDRGSRDARKETTIEVSDRPRRRRARPTCRTGLPFYDHMLDQLGRHGGFDLTVAGHRRPAHRHATTRSRTSRIVLGEAFREALGDKAGVRRFASGLFPLDEALVEVALDLSGRPFVVWEVPTARVPARSATRRSTRSWPSTLSAVVRHRGRHHAARHAARAAATCTTSSRPRSRAWPGACATPCGSRARGVPSHQGRRCERRGRDRLVAVLDYGIGNLRSARRRSSTSAPTPGSPPTAA